MKYAVELYYDSETERSIYALSEAVADAGISAKFLEWKTRPHLTLACFNDVDTDLCAERLRVFAQSHDSMPAHIWSVGMFNDTKTVFVSPVMNSAMFRLQRELHEAFRDLDTTGWEWYLPDNWAPHTAVALTSEDKDGAFLKASELVLRRFKKLDGWFVKIGLVKITFPVEEIFTAELGK